MFLLTVFGKGERSDLSKAERNALAQLTRSWSTPSRRSEAHEQARVRQDQGRARGRDRDRARRGRSDATYRVHVPAEVDVKAIRQKLGMSQAAFAASFGFALDAVQNWEQGRRRPEGAARAFLKVIDREPDAVRRALAA